MKKSIQSILIIGALTVMGFKTIYEAKKSTAEVEQMQGLYVFIHSKPVGDYEYIGSLTPTFVPSANAKPIINHMIKKGKEKYPEATGIIFTDDQLGKVDLIILK
jgi:hypothetical protein